MPAEEGTGAKNLGKMLAEMMKAPEMKNVLKQQQLAQIDMMYGGLFNRLHLNDGEKQDLKKMIGERLQKEGELGFRLLEDGLSAEDKKEALKAFTDSKNASDLQIKTFLNSEQDYQLYQSWEESKPERMALNLGRESFVSAGAPLTPEQEDQLVKAMTTARIRRSDIPDFSKVENFGSLGADEKAFAKITAAFDSQAQEVFAAAASFLNPKQLEALKNMQEHQREMQAAGLKIGATMFNQKK